MTMDMSGGHLLQLMRAMSPADLSVIETAARRAGNQAVTIAGSANDMLWSDFVALGWMKTVPVPEGLPDNIRVFEVTAAGAAPISGLLQRLNRQ